MKKISITEAKNSLSALIDGLKGGSSVLIMDRGRPVARLEPVTSDSEAESDGRLSRLIREGAVRPGRAPLAKSCLSGPLPKLKAEASAVEALLKERREER
jgi:antitoxin (DNA-binding transcriptional repressor) of toxin-antitoxin stability system